MTTSLLEPEKPQFLNRLVVTLELTIGSKKHTVVAGNIKNIHLDYHSWGYTCSLDWWVICLKAQSEDTLFADFIKSDLIEVKLTIDRKFDKVGETAEPIVLKGLGTDKAAHERAFGDLSGAPVLHRHYSLQFADRAQVLWRQHFPCSLYVDKTIKDLIDDHKPKGVKVTYSWSAANTKHAVLSLGLGGPGNEASFYDFLWWLLARENASLYYDGAKDSYEIGSAKKSLTKEEDLPRDGIELLEAYFPPTDRAEVTVLNGCTEVGTKEKKVANANKATGVRRNYLIVSSVNADINTRGTLETNRHKANEPEAHVYFGRYPAVGLMPALTVVFNDGWSDKIFQNKKKYRIESMHVRAEAESRAATDDAEDPSNSYNTAYWMRCELKDDKRMRYPAYVVPKWPYHVEGKVVSEQGSAKQGTYQGYKNKTTSLDEYKVTIPLFKKQKVVVPYNPARVSGHFYFPAYKDERVLVALEFQRAWISRFIDWRPAAKLPQTTQGNNLQLGKAPDDGTSMHHIYKDAKPVFGIHRTNKKDTQFLTISEGTLLLKTSEEGKSKK